MPFRSFVLSLALVAPVLSLPIPWNHNNVATNSDNIYSGQGGSADGGSVRGSDAHTGLLPLGAGGLLNAFSNNAGQGGVASSGPTVVGDNAHRSGPNGSTKMVNAANAYSGPGGYAAGGSVDSPNPGLVNLWSSNAGSGGLAGSGGVTKLPV